MVELASDIILATLVGALIGGGAATIGAYLALRHRAHSAERARMATEIMYHVMTAVVLLEEALGSLGEVLLARDKGKGKKELRDMAEAYRKDLQRAFAGYDPLRPHVDYRVGKVMRLPEPAMKMLGGLGQGRGGTEVRGPGNKERRRRQEVRPGAQASMSTFGLPPLYMIKIKKGIIPPTTLCPQRTSSEMS
jgi:hypothetical protein